MESRLSQYSCECHVQKMSAKKGIKLFKDRAVTTIVNLYTQLNDMNVMSPENPYVLAPPKIENHLEL